MLLQHSLKVLLLFCMLPSPGSQWSVGNSNMRNLAEFLYEHCVDIASFVPEVCGGAPLGSECCALFTIVGFCSPSCSRRGASALFHLESLQYDADICAALRQTEQTLCPNEPTASEQCQRLFCLNNMMCYPYYDFSCFFQSRTSVFYGAGPLQQGEATRENCDNDSSPAPASQTQHAFMRDNCYGLPETTDSQGTGLVSDENSELSEVSLDDTVLNCSGPNIRRYRTIDGSCNNLRYPRWGRAFEPQVRLLAPVYEDGNLPRRLAKNGNPLPLPRRISTQVTQMHDALAGCSNMMMAWAQFIDHDETGTPVIKNGTKALKCCGDIPDELKVENGGPCDPMELPPGDVLGSCMNFVRSLAYKYPNGSQAMPRQQINALSSYLDGSAVYGSSQKELDKLRGEHGKMRVRDQNMLPEDPQGTCKKQSPGDYCFLAGDKRASVFVGLGVQHTAFVREHNRLATVFKGLNPSWSDETIFQEARRIIAAQFQRITYAEWLPLLLGTHIVENTGLAEGYFHYDPTLDATSANSFSTATFRMGHSQVKQLVKVANVTFALQDSLMRTESVINNMAAVLKGLITEQTDDLDENFATGLTNHMFETGPGVFDGLDLIAINIKRGRDHGLPPYNEWRKFCGLDPIEDFDSPELKANLGVVYEDMDDVDLFMGMILEKHIPGALVGPLLACLLADQFKATKFGDRFYYETTSSPEGFTEDQLKEIKKVTLARVLCENIGLEEIQENVFKLPDPETNPVRPCEDLPSMDLSKWESRPGGPFYVE